MTVFITYKLESKNLFVHQDLLSNEWCSADKIVTGNSFDTAVGMDPRINQTPIADIGGTLQVISQKERLILGGVKTKGDHASSHL